ncbi:MAG TPA: toprim domain-containing protein, partial [Planctomycetota bacterium]|nr:toprim domain-containing protein [Planctomycetota bacterium]
RSMRLCPVCFQHCTGPVCGLCANPSRNHKQICVVEMAADIAAFERSGVYEGAYHVLLGRLSPLGGVLPEDLTGGALLIRAAGRLGKAAGGVESTGAQDSRVEESTPPEAGAGTHQEGGSGGPHLPEPEDAPVEAQMAQETVLAELVARHPWLGEPAEEVILATSATAEGEATAAWLEGLLEPLDIAITRIARGLPIGAEVAFAQRSTLATALKNRSSVRK